MRKLLILLAVALLTLTVTKAQDKPPQAPIIAQYQNKIFAVSPDDGSTRTLVELPADEIFSWEFILPSLDSTKLLYSTQIDTTDTSDPNAISTGYEKLYLLDVTDGTSTELQAKGGVFDRKPADHVFTVGYRTWSIDGTRVYFTRMELDRKYDLVQVQIVYYELATQQYHLVMRTDEVPYLYAVPNGVMANWSNHQIWSLFTPDNHTVPLKALTGIYGYPLQYKGQPYFVRDDNSGGFSTVVNIETGEKTFIGGGYHMAMRSLSAGDQSLITLWTPKNVTIYRMVENKPKLVQEIPTEPRGVITAVSPDGQSAAYLKFDEFGYALLRIITPDGYTREFPILAGSIVWGASEKIAFHKPVR